MLVSAIGFLIVLTVVVFVHEFGHYYAARRCGVRVEEFSIGFGRQLWFYFDKLGTFWRIRLIPLGGFVKMYDDSNSAVVEQKDYSFSSKSVIKRAIIIIAGPVANFLLAIMIFSSLYVVSGRTEIYPVVGVVVESSPAFKAGLLEGDLILKADSYKIKTFNDLRDIVSSRPNQEISLEVQRNNQIRLLKITPFLKGKLGFIGVLPDKNKIKHVHMGVIDSILMAISDTYVTSLFITKSIGEIIFGSESIDNMSGVIAIARLSGEALESGSILLLIAFISINVGLINLLPIPILDGGRLLFLLYEAIIGKKLSNRLESICYVVGMWVMIFLVVISILNDIKSLLF